MADITRITWCDSTFTPWMGCTKVSPACDHCYAERDTKRFGLVEWGAGKPRWLTSSTYWRKPLSWNATPFFECESCGSRYTASGYRKMLEGGAIACCPDHKPRPARRRVFCASLADVFDNEADPAWRREVLDLIARTPKLDWLLRTKRIGNVASMMPVPSPNVWRGVHG